MTFNNNSAVMLTSLLYRVKATHSLKPVISAGVRSPAPSGQEMDGDACLLRGLELQHLSDLFWDITLGSMLNQRVVVFFSSSVFIVAAALLSPAFPWGDPPQSPVGRLCWAVALLLAWDMLASLHQHGPVETPSGVQQKQSR